MFKLSTLTVLVKTGLCLSWYRTSLSLDVDLDRDLRTGGFSSDLWRSDRLLSSETRRRDTLLACPLSESRDCEVLSRDCSAGSAEDLSLEHCLGGVGEISVSRLEEEEDLDLLLLLELDDDPDLRFCSLPFGEGDFGLVDRSRLVSPIQDIATDPMDDLFDSDSDGIFP